MALSDAMACGGAVACSDAMACSDLCGRHDSCRHHGMWRRHVPQRRHGLRHCRGHHRLWGRWPSACVALLGPSPSPLDLLGPSRLVSPPKWTTALAALTPGAALPPTCSLGTEADLRPQVDRPPLFRQRALPKAGELPIPLQQARPCPASGCPGAGGRDAHAISTSKFGQALVHAGVHSGERRCRRQSRATHLLTMCRVQEKTAASTAQGLARGALKLEGIDGVAFPIMELMISCIRVCSSKNFLWSGVCRTIKFVFRLSKGIRSPTTDAQASICTLASHFVSSKPLEPCVKT